MKILIFLFLLSALLGGCYYDNYSELNPAAVLRSNCDTDSVTYTVQISAIMNTYCVGCHSSNSPPDNIELDNYSGTMNAAKSANMLPCILNQNGNPMPPTGTPLSPCLIREIELWIQNNYPQ